MFMINKMLNKLPNQPVHYFGFKYHGSKKC